ncbi:MAG: AlkA N-terminal domain-containing protein [Betaproteobacteria bacterium]
MLLDAPSCYRALCTHDARFDGRFFVGVATTRIYCRPVCTVRTPHARNCRYFRSAAAAEVGGYRPCLRCRPELAPGSASVDALDRLAQAAVGLIEDGRLEEGGLEALAAALRITSRHVRRVFATTFGVSPVAYAQTHRLLLAKRLLTDTALPVTEVAFASGFGSVRRFNALFNARYRMPPARLRRNAANTAPGAPLRFELAYRPPYDWPAMLEFLAARAVPCMEAITAQDYFRTLRIAHNGAEHAGWIRVGNRAPRSTLVVELSHSLARVVAPVLSRVRHAFDTNCDPEAIAAALGALSRRHPGLRVPGAVDGFELAVRAIVGQQVSVRAARTLMTRLVRALGEPLAASLVLPEGSLDRMFPAAQRVADVDVGVLTGLGLTGARARAVMALSRAVACKAVRLDPRADVADTTAALLALPGIGPWTVELIAMRALGWPDAFPASDGVILRAMNETSPARAAARSAQWQPWRSYAVMHLWRKT